MAKYFEDVEFTILTRELNGVSEQRIMSGIPGQLGEFTLDAKSLVADGWKLEMHTHPPGILQNVASRDDQFALTQFNQETSKVVLPDGSTFTYSTFSRNIEAGNTQRLN